MTLQNTRIALPTMTLFAVLSSWAAMAADSVPAGRYLDRNVQVQDAAQLNPLRQIGSLQFSDRVLIGDAVQTALAGTGYRLAAGSHPNVHALLNSRVALSHIRFDEKRIDSVVAALVGVGRGYALEVDHTARLIRIVPAVQAPAPATLELLQTRAAKKPPVRPLEGDR